MTTASPPVENSQYAAFARRILRAYARRISAGDIDALADITILAADIDNAIRHAVTGLRDNRLLLGRDRRPARRHPPGRAAALGRHPAMTVRNTALKSGAHITWTQYKTARCTVRRPGTHRLVLGTRPRQERHLGPPRPARTRRARRHQGLPHGALSRRIHRDRRLRRRPHGGHAMSTSGAAAAIAPEPERRPGAGGNSRRQVITFADFRSWERQLARTGACAHPVRLHGRITAIDLATGEAAPVYDSRREPAGCCTSRAATAAKHVCPACSAVYKRDARQLVRAGLTGGKGVPESVAAHPCVFATLTAPSFGPVHARRMRGKTVLPCRPRRDANDRRCPHGRDISCPVRHAEHDPRLGRPMCPRLLRLRSRRAVQPARHRTCGAGSPPTCPGTWPGSPGSPASGCAPSCGSATSRSPNTRHAASSTSTP